jgi:segregation and condensation protein B
LEKVGANSVKTEAIIEALLFSSPEPLALEVLAEITQKSKKAVKQALQKLQSFYQEQDRAFQITQTALGYQLKTKQEFSSWVKKNHCLTKHYLSKPALETLAVIAYKQPISKQEINHTRRVDSSGTLKSLLKKNLIRIAGRSDNIGKPLLYATSKKFLDAIGLKNLSDLPKMDE